MTLLAEESYLTGDFLELSSKDVNFLEEISFRLFTVFVHHAVGEALIIG